MPLTHRQAAAMLLLHMLDHGNLPTQLTAKQIAAILQVSKVTDDQRTRILFYCEQTLAPFKSRLKRIVSG